MKSDSYQFVVWGYRNTYHTHGYEHEAIYRALSHLGRRVRWLDESSPNDDFEKTIFISQNNVATNVPVRQDALYIVHNFYRGNAAVEERLKDCNVLHFGVKTNRTFFTGPRAVDIYWATDLLPHEIENNKRDAKLLNENSRIINWVGTISQSGFSNSPEIFAFRDEALKHGISFNVYGGYSGPSVSMSENARLIRESYMAPAIVGSWQREEGYIPTRIFKNISYGAFGVTNSEDVNNVFSGGLIQNGDTRQLFYDAKNALKKMSIDRLYDLMDEVAKKHTYINRIEQLLAKAENLL